MRNPVKGNNCERKPVVLASSHQQNLHPKNQLEGWLRENGRGEARYKCISDMEFIDFLRPSYDMECVLDDGTRTKGAGRSGKNAARNAAIMMLRKLGVPCGQEIKF